MNADKPMTFILVHSRDIELVKRYLPSNYFPFFVRMNHTVVVGKDSYGWTAEDYVIPRLKSALVPAMVVTPEQYLTKYGLPVLPPANGKHVDQVCEHVYHKDDGNEYICNKLVGHSGEHGKRR